MTADPPSPSPFFTAHLEVLRDVRTRGVVLDLACGRGRHAVPAAAAGLPVVGLDRSAAFLAQLRAIARARGLSIASVRADLEHQDALPLARGRCDAVLVFRFLHRPLAPAIVEALRPGGLLLYETFTQDQRKLGYGPSNPRFLLAPGELPELFRELDVLSYDEGLRGAARPEAVARLVARKRA